MRASRIRHFQPPGRGGWISRSGVWAMAAREIGVKKYVVKLSEAERNHLQALINKGKSAAKRLLKARILLKADAGAHGEGWSGSLKPWIQTYPW